MAAESSPEEALQIAVDTRRAAAPPRVPRWFPVFMGASFGLAMVAIGLSTCSEKTRQRARPSASRGWS
jgi:hypothetical protein